MSDEKLQLVLIALFFFFSGFLVGSVIMCYYCMNTESGRDWMIRALSKYHHIQVIK